MIFLLNNYFHNIFVECVLFYFLIFVVTNFKHRDSKCWYNRLKIFNLWNWGGWKGNYAEPDILCFQMLYNTTVSIVPGSSMCLIDNQENYFWAVKDVWFYIFLKSLRGHKEHSFNFVHLLSFMFWKSPCQFCYVVHRNLWNKVRERLNLLSNKWLGRCDEKNHAIFEPPVKVKHHCGSNEGFSKSCRQRYQSILKQRGSHYFKLVSSKRFWSWVDPSA